MGVCLLCYDNSSNAMKINSTRYVFTTKKKKPMVDDNNYCITYVFINVD